MNSPRLTRRLFLVAGASATAVLGIGGHQLWQSAPERHAAWVESVIRKHLPHATLDQDSLRMYVTHVLDSDVLTKTSRRLAVFAQQTVPWVAARIPKVSNGIDKLERRVLTDYLLGSNFFRVTDAREERIVYYGPATVCANPFATFV